MGRRKEFTGGMQVVTAKYGLGTVLNAAAKELVALGYRDPLRHLQKIAQAGRGTHIPFKHVCRWNLSFTPKDSHYWWTTKRILVVVLLSCDERHKKSYHNWDVESVEVLNPPYFRDYEPITFL